MLTTSLESPWRAYSRPNPQARLRLFCFPYAGGEALIFRNWAESLPSSVDVYAVQLPGRGGRMTEPLFTSLPPLIGVTVQALLPHLDKPFAFFGHSMGALISFELARLLSREKGRQPAHLFVSGRRAPQLADKERITYNLPKQEFIEELRRLKGTPDEVIEQPELMEVMLPIVRADFKLCQTYVYSPGPPLSCPITAFGGLEDKEVTREHLEAWREQSSATFSLRMLPGDHFFLRESESMLLTILSRELSRLVSLLDRKDCR